MIKEKKNKEKSWSDRFPGSISKEEEKFMKGSFKFYKDFICGDISKEVGEK